MIFIKLPFFLIFFAIPARIVCSQNVYFFKVNYSDCVAFKNNIPALARHLPDTKSTVLLIFLF